MTQLLGVDNADSAYMAEENSANMASIHFMQPPCSQLSTGHPVP